MRYSIEQLEAFVLSAQLGSFSAAARKLGKTQSTISFAIANLEADFGVALFDRSSRNPRLTVKGQKLLIDAAALLERCLSLEGHADNLVGDTVAALTLAIEVPHRTVMQVLSEFAQEFPYVDLAIRQPMDGDVSDLVLKGQAELGVAFSQPNYPQDLEFQQVGKLIMVHVVHHNHPLSNNDQVSFADMNRYRRLAFTAHTTKLPSTEYLRTTQTWEAESYFAILEMVKAGLGWATLPRQLILNELEQGELIELQIDAYPFTDWLVGVDLIWERKRPSSRPERWLRDQLKNNQIYELDRRGQSTIR